MTGIRLVRMRTCHECAHRCTRHSKHWKWPRCTFYVSGRDKGQPGNEMDLDEWNLEGPDSNCPLGLWNNLEPVDLAKSLAATKAKGIEAETAWWARLLDILSPDEKTALDVRPKLEQLVALELVRYSETADALEAHVNGR